MRTTNGYNIPTEMVGNYLGGLVNQFFKILPIKESGEPSLNEFMRSLQVELLGHKGLMRYLKYDSMYMALLSILQYLIDNDCDTPVVKREVFKAISICKKLSWRESEWLIYQQVKYRRCNSINVQLSNRM